MKYDPATGERLTVGTATFNLVRCVGCGITNGDGDPALNIPYPIIEARESYGGEMLCETCEAEQKTDSEAEKRSSES
jgi:hypothetical protein